MGYRDVKFEHEFYAMGQMSRVARPGAQRIGANVKAGNGDGLNFAAFTLPGGQTSLVVLNEHNTETAFQVEDHGNFFSYQLPDHSIATFVWWRWWPPPPLEVFSNSACLPSSTRRSRPVAPNGEYLLGR